MCGIAGFNRHDPIAMCTAIGLMTHRGPDDEGVYADEQITFGHRRLSILDLSEAGHQPMFYARATGACSASLYPDDMNGSSVGIVYNGEIYNFHEIQAELEKTGYKFRTRCDTEAVLAAYLAWGPACVERFNGMWAFCILDKRSNTLILSRDRFGKKPLYYSSIGNSFIFGSELKALLALGVPREIDQAALNHFLMFAFLPSERSIYKNVFKLPAGHTLIYDLKHCRIVQKTSYWRPNFCNSIRSPQEAGKDLRTALQEAVAKRMVADVPVGAFLSGGLDSSIIVSLMKTMAVDCKTFSVSFDYPDFDESAWAKLVARHFGTEHHEITFGPRDIESLALELSRFYDEPFGDPSMVPTYLVSRVASEHVKVCLSGMGSDELFAGYPRQREYGILLRLLPLTTGIKDAGAKLYSRFNRDRGAKLGQLLHSRTPAELYLRLFSSLSRRKEEVEVDWNSIIAEYDPLFHSGNHLNDALAFEQRVYLTENGLVKEDRATMANSLEGRCPFLDPAVVAIANSLDPILKLHRGTGKAILRQAFEDLIPRSVLNRKKQGFGVPLNHYFRNELYEFGRHQIFDFEGPRYYDMALMRELWESHQQKKNDYSPLFWLVIMFNTWYNRWMI